MIPFTDKSIQDLMAFARRGVFLHFLHHLLLFRRELGSFGAGFLRFLGGNLGALRLRGVTDIPWMGPFGQQGGFTAWLLWLLIHITYLIGFANRLVVATRWAFSFLTRGRSTRLITGQPLVPPIDEPMPMDHAGLGHQALPEDGGTDGQLHHHAREAATSGAPDRS